MIVGYGMKTKSVAVGFALNYMSQSTTNNCAATGVSAISGYNTMVPANMSGSTVVTTITTAALCATNTTMFFQNNSINATGCYAATCIGVSQPLFNVAEDWAQTADLAFYLVGAIEWGAGYGTGAYESRIIKIDTNGAVGWDQAALANTSRSNCNQPATIFPVDDTRCDRSNGNSVWLSARMSDNSHTSTRWLFLGGVLLSAQSPMNYKNGW